MKPPSWISTMAFFCVLLFIFNSFTRSSIAHLRFESVALVLQGFDFTFLGEEEVGSHGLAHDQNAGQQGYACHFVGSGGATAEGTGKLLEFNLILVRTRYSFITDIYTKCVTSGSEWSETPSCLTSSFKCLPSIAPFRNCLCIDTKINAP